MVTKLHKILLYNPEAIENIFNKLDIENNVEKQLEAEKIVVVCKFEINTFAMYKILALLIKRNQKCA